MQCIVLPHITASVFISDDESGLHHDYEVWLEQLAPYAPIDQYWHNRTGQACYVSFSLVAAVAPGYIHGLVTGLL